MTAFPRPCLMLVTEPTPGLPRIVSEAIIGGVDIVQWRDKTTPQPELMAQAPLITAALHPHTFLVVNGSLTLAEAVGHGLHLPEDGVLSPALRAAFGPKALFGKSVHSVAAARQAQQEGAAYLIAGTIYPSSSHPDAPPRGIDFLREVCQSVGLPVLAIGGVTPGKVQECMEAGAAGVAVLSAVLHAQDPRAAAQSYRAALDAAEDGKS